MIGRTFDEHLKNLGEVLKGIKITGLKLRRMMCALFQQQVKYFRHLATANVVSTDEDKIRALKNWPRPQDLYEVRSFLGQCTYYSA